MWKVGVFECEGCKNSGMRKWVGKCGREKWPFWIDFFDTNPRKFYDFVLSDSQ